MEILKKFEMLDWKAIATPMASNLNLLCDSSSKLVDAMMYHQMIGSLMYLTNTTPTYNLREHLELVPDRSETCSPYSFKACI